MSRRRDLLTRDEEGVWVVSAPAVGRWENIPREGAWLGPGDTAGTLRRLNDVDVLVVPAGVGGVVRQKGSRDRAWDVGYQTELFRLEPLGDVAAGTETGASGGADGLIMPAPTDGIFYRRPGPDAPAFAEVGAVVERGQAIGLIEVMKTFNRIAYEGDGLPERAKVVEFLAGDGDEISAGQPLVKVEPT